MLPVKNKVTLPIRRGPRFGSRVDPDSFKIFIMYDRNALNPLHSTAIHNTPTQE